MSWTKSLQSDRDHVRGIVLQGFLAFRRAGLSRRESIYELSNCYQISQRKIRSIVFNEPFALLSPEVKRIVSGKYHSLRWLAEYHRQLAKYWDLVADHDQEKAQNQFRETAKWPEQRANSQGIIV